MKLDNINNIFINNNVGNLSYLIDLILNYFNFEKLKHINKYNNII